VTASLGIPQDLAFGTHKDYLWKEGYSLEPLFGGKQWIAGISYQDQIVKGSPDCKKTLGNNSTDCNEASLYQITVLENWEEIAGTHQVEQCIDLETTVRDLKKTIATTEESFNEKIGNTIRHETEDEYNTSMKNELTTKVSGDWGVVKASAEHKLTINEEEKHRTLNSSERSTEIQRQTGTSFSVHIEQETTIKKTIDLSEIKMQYMDMQKFTTVKYDLWTPVTNSPSQGFVPDKVMVRSPDYYFVGGGEERLPYDEAHIFKAHDLPGDQYYIHLTYDEKYPTATKEPREERSNWDCLVKTTEGRILPAAHPDKKKNIDELNVFFRPTTNHANIIVVDNELKPVSGAKVTIGIPSIPLRPGADACTSIDNWVKTDKFGSAYFYLESEPPSNVFDDLENEKSKGLVALFRGNGDFKDEIVGFNGRLFDVTDASFEDGVMGQAFVFKDGRGFAIKDSEDFDITKAVTISAWIKTNGDKNWQPIVHKTAWPETRNYGFYLNKDSLHLSYLSPPGKSSFCIVTSSGSGVTHVLVTVSNT